MFLQTGHKKGGRLSDVEIFSEKGAELKLANNIAAEIVVCRGEKEARTSDRLLRMQTEPGETITIHGVAVT